MKKRIQKNDRKPVPDADLVRLQKLLASHGKGSRRACEQFILDGRVEVDGKVVGKLGTKVDPGRQKITLDGERLITPSMQYFMLNKPPGVVSTANDPSGRTRVIDLIKTSSRVYNVGRLDKSSEGLILVTNDGDLANKLTHPRYGIEKKYHVLVSGGPNREVLDSLKKGVYLAEARVRVRNIRVKKRLRDRTWLEIVLDEGRNREIRRILAKIGHKVIQLRRVAIGPLLLGDLPLGSYRKLTSAEVKRLKIVAAANAKSKSGGRRTKASKNSNKSEKSFSSTARVKRSTGRTTKTTAMRSSRKKKATAHGRKSRTSRSRSQRTRMTAKS